MIEGGAPLHAMPVATQRSRRATERILIVDDDPSVRRPLSRLLSHSGYEAHTAANGDEAVLKAKEGSPDLIVLDLGMPGRDGLAVCEYLRSHPTLFVVPVIVCSGSAPGPSRERALALGAKDFLPKPVSYPDLLERIRKILAGKEP